MCLRDCPPFSIGFMPKNFGSSESFEILQKVSAVFSGPNQLIWKTCTADSWTRWLEAWQAIAVADPGPSALHLIPPPALATGPGCRSYRTSRFCVVPNDIDIICFGVRFSDRKHPLCWPYIELAWQHRQEADAPQYPSRVALYCVLNCLKREMCRHKKVFDVEFSPLVT